MTTETAYANGVLTVHSAPVVLATQIDWLLSRAIGTRVTLDWIDQPVAPGTLRADARWHAPIGTGARITSQLLGWRGVRFEMTEFATATSDGSRWLYTPNLGILHQNVDSAGNTLLNETLVRDVLERSSSIADCEALFGRALGQAWDAELDIFRAGAYGEQNTLSHFA